MYRSGRVYNVFSSDFVAVRLDKDVKAGIPRLPFSSSKQGVH